MSPTPLDEALDPTTTTARLSELSSDAYEPDVRRAAMRNPNLDEDFLAILLEVGAPDGWANPSAPLVQLGRSLLLPDQMRAALIDALRYKRADIGPALRANTEDGIEVWWQSPDTSAVDRGDHLALLGQGAGTGSPEHRRAVGLALEVARRILAAYQDRGYTEWVLEAEQSVATIEAWLEGEEVDLSHAYDRGTLPMFRLAPPWEERHRLVMRPLLQLVSLALRSNDRSPLYSSFVDSYVVVAPHLSPLAIDDHLRAHILATFPHYPWPPSLTP